MSYSVSVLFEDNDVLVVNKPAGLVVHSDGRTKEPTLVEWVLKNYPKIKGVCDVVSTRGGSAFGGKDKGLRIKDAEWSLDRSGIVHRLDRETSCALLIAKNQTAFARLKKQFQRQQVHKTYHAFVYGSVKQDDGLIDRPIARSRTNPVLWSATRGRRGEEREAVTEYRVLGRLILPYQGEHSPSAARRGVTAKDSPLFSFLELYPRTGRTHQLRVHLKAINYPIV